MSLILFTSNSVISSNCELICLQFVSFSIQNRFIISISVRLRDILQLM